MSRPRSRGQLGLMEIHPVYPQFQRVLGGAGLWDYRRARGFNGIVCEAIFCRGSVTGTRRVCFKCSSRLYKINNPLGAALRNVKGRAKRKGIPFKIAKRHILALPGGKGWPGNGLHLDRKIPARGYIPGNIQLLTQRENIAKGNRERDYTGRKVNKNNQPF